MPTARPPTTWWRCGRASSSGDVLANGSHVDSLIGGEPTHRLRQPAADQALPAGQHRRPSTRWPPAGSTTSTPGNGPSRPAVRHLRRPRPVHRHGPDRRGRARPAAGRRRQRIPRHLVRGGQRQAVLLDRSGQHHGRLHASTPTARSRSRTPATTSSTTGRSRRIVGTAVSLNADNNKLNVSFFGPASADPPGNYWIVDLAPDYSWAIVTDSTGSSGFLLSRTPTVSDELYQELLDRASVKGVNGRITRTRQPQAAAAAAAAASTAGSSPKTRSQLADRQVTDPTARHLLTDGPARGQSVWQHVCTGRTRRQPAPDRP